MKYCLVTRPEHDDTTHFISNWVKKCIDLSEDVEIIDLWREQANQKEVISRLEKQKPSLVFLNGHGSSTMVSGHNNEPLIVAGKNEKLLQGKIVHALSCKSALILGRKSVKEGASAYIGYDDDFIFTYQPTMISRPTKDSTAKLFLDPATKPLSWLLKGHTVKDAYNKSQEAYKQNIKKLLLSKDPEQRALVRFLWWNMKNQVALGDQQAAF